MSRQTIYRNARPDSGYAEISNKLLQCKGLSLDARGFQAYFFSQKFDWRFNMAHARRELDIGESKAERLVRELIEHGFIRKSAVSRSNGTLGPLVYEFTDVPFTFEPNEGDGHSVETTPPYKELRGGGSKEKSWATS